MNLSPDLIADPRQARLKRQQARRRHRASEFGDTPVASLHGGSTPIKTVIASVKRIHDQVEDEARAGSHRHRRISRAQHWHIKVLPAMDALVLFWFLLGVLNADLRRPDATVMIAAVLALLCTVAIAAWNAGIGHYLRRFKAHDGGLVTAEIDRMGRVMLGATVTTWTLLGAMMYLRVSDEIYQATAVPGVGAAIIGLVLAAAIVLVNAYVTYLAFSDGSELTSDLDALSQVLAVPVRQHLHDLAVIDSIEHHLQYQAAARQRRIASPDLDDRHLVLVDRHNLTERHSKDVPATSWWPS